MARQVGVPCSVLRGGTSKGLYFLAADLPADKSLRDAFLIAAMGSPDIRQIDGMGGAHPLTSKVAVVSRSVRPGVDVDYLFLQVWPDRAEVSDNQNCGNILAGVGPFALECGLVEPKSGLTEVKIWMENTGSLATATIETPDGHVNYEGTHQIAGVPGEHAPIKINFEDIAGSSCGSLLPTGNIRDEVGGLMVTCIDNGMPVVCVAASDLGITGYESPEDLEGNQALKAKVEQLRLAAGAAMGMGDVKNDTVPKISILAKPRDGGSISTRTFIPHRVHDAIGVLGAVSVATACAIPGSVASALSSIEIEGETSLVSVEHPTGNFQIEIQISSVDGEIELKRAALLRTARLLMTGTVFVPASALESK